MSTYFPWDDPQALLSRPDNFGYHGDLDEKLFKTWSLGPTLQQRDSGLVEEVNAITIEKMLTEKFPPDSNDTDCWVITRSKHWAVGWIDQLCFQVYQDDGTIHPIVSFLKEIYDRLSNYPLLDDELHSRRQSEEQQKIFKQEFTYLNNKHDWFDEIDEKVMWDIYSECWDMDSITIEENHWDITKEAIEDAMDSLELQYRGMPED